MTDDPRLDGIRACRQRAEREREMLESLIVAARNAPDPPSLKAIGDAAGMTPEGVRQLLLRRAESRP